MNEDCKVCQRLIKQKHRNDFIWKIACLVFAALAIIFGILYFGSGAMVTESEIAIERTDFNNNGDNGSIIIGDENSIIKGEITTVDNTAIICLSIILGATIVTGGIICAYNSISKNKDNN